MADSGGIQNSSLQHLTVLSTLMFTCCFISYVQIL